ncbi:MAG TPA: SDR family NAD(P)-dependent oxidoreductase [Bacteroidales bacterium]|nr:SDR family NAD(P)-dependent oxidoreductase [Bacteroidales bacterium]
MNILITGCSKGLGFGLSKYYLERGHRVFGISRSGNSKLAGYEGFSHLKQDLGNFETVAHELQAFLKSIDELDLIILNAGIINGIKDVKDTEIEEMMHVMDVNVWANKVVIDTLFKAGLRPGHIVAISSGASVSGSRGWNAYSISKAALNMLISLYSKEFTDTRFTALAPGLIDTGMQEYLTGLSEKEDYPVISKLRKARGTDQMPGPEEAAVIVASGIEKSKKYETGSFLDVRKLS